MVVFGYASGIVATSPEFEGPCVGQTQVHHQVSGGYASLPLNAHHSMHSNLKITANSC